MNTTSRPNMYRLTIKYAEDHIESYWKAFRNRAEAEAYASNFPQTIVTAESMYNTEKK